MFLPHSVILRCQKKYTKFYTLFHYETSKKQELQQITFNHLLDIDFQDFKNHYKKCTKKLYSFLAIDAASDNLLHFKKNLSEGILKLIMKINDKIRD